MLYSYPFVAHTGWASHVFEPTAQIIVRPNRVDQRRAARRGRQEPGVRRHAAVRHRQVLGLRPLRDRHARQRRHAVHLPGQQRRSTPARCSARAYTSPATTPSSIPGCRLGRDALTNVAELLARQRPADRPLGLRGRPLPVAVHRPEPHRAGPVRREGLDPAPPGHASCRPATGPFSGSVGYTFTHFEPVLGLIRQPAGIALVRSGCKLTNHWSVLGQMRYDIDAKAAHPGHDPAQVRGRVLRADGELHRDVRREHGAGSEAGPHADAALRAQAPRRVQLPDRSVLNHCSANQGMRRP